MRFAHFAVAALLSASAASLRLQASPDEMPVLAETTGCPGVVVTSADPPADPCGKIKAKIDAKVKARTEKEKAKGPKPMHAARTAKGKTVVNTKSFQAPWVNENGDTEEVAAAKKEAAKPKGPGGGPPLISMSHVATIIDSTMVAASDPPAIMQDKLAGAEALQRALNDQATRFEQMYKSAEQNERRVLEHISKVKKVIDNSPYGQQQEALARKMKEAQQKADIEKLVKEKMSGVEASIREKVGLEYKEPPKFDPRDHLEEAVKIAKTDTFQDYVNTRKNAKKPAKKPAAAVPGAAPAPPAPAPAAGAPAPLPAGGPAPL